MKVSDFHFGNACLRTACAVAAITVALSASATNHILRQDQLMAGFNGDRQSSSSSSLSAAMTRNRGDRKARKSSAAAMLVFFNAMACSRARSSFCKSAQGGLSVLIAPRTLLIYPRPCAGHPHSAAHQPRQGKVVFRRHPANPFHFDGILPSYGTFPAIYEVPARRHRVATTGEPVSPHARPDFGFSGTSKQRPISRSAPQFRSTHVGQTFASRGWTGD